MMSLVRNEMTLESMKNAVSLASVIPSFKFLYDFQIFKYCDMWHNLVKALKPKTMVATFSSINMYIYEKEI